MHVGFQSQAMIFSCMRHSKLELQITSPQHSSVRVPHAYLPTLRNHTFWWVLCREDHTCDETKQTAVMNASQIREVDEKAGHSVSTTGTTPAFVAQDPYIVAQRQRRHQWERRRFTVAALAIFTVVSGLSRLQEVARAWPLWTAESDGNYVKSIGRGSALVITYSIIGIVANSAASICWPRLRADGSPIPLFPPPEEPVAPKPPRKQKRDTTVFIMLLYLSFGRGSDLLLHAVFDWIFVFLKEEPTGRGTVQYAMTSTLTTTAATLSSMHRPGRWRRSCTEGNDSVYESDMPVASSQAQYGIDMVTRRNRNLSVTGKASVSAKMTSLLPQYAELYMMRVYQFTGSQAAPGSQ